MLALMQQVGHEFGIAVLVTSHLLGELERVSDHVVVLDGGRLLRSSATDGVPARDRQPDRRGARASPTPSGCSARRWSAAGLTARPAGGALIEVELVERRAHVRTSSATSPSTSASAWCGCRSGTSRIEDVFRDGGAGSVLPV